MSVNELSPLALLAVAEIFNLNHDGDGIVVVNFKEVDLLALDLREDSFTDYFHAEGGLVRQHVSDLVVRPLSVGDEIDQLVRDLLGLLLRGEDDALGARTRHDAIEETNRIGDHP